MFDVEEEFEHLLEVNEGDSNAPGTLRPMRKRQMAFCDLAADTGARADERASVATRVKPEFDDQLSAAHVTASDARDDDFDPTRERGWPDAAPKRPTAKVLVPVGYTPNDDDLIFRTRVRNCAKRALDPCNFEGEKRNAIRQLCRLLDLPDGEKPRVAKLTSLARDEEGAFSQLSATEVKVLLPSKRFLRWAQVLCDATTTMCGAEWYKQTQDGYTTITFYGVHAEARAAADVFVTAYNMVSLDKHNDHAPGTKYNGIDFQCASRRW